MSNEIWQDVNRTSDGLGITTYSQDLDQNPVVEDESWWTWSEIRAMIPDE